LAVSATEGVALGGGGATQPIDRMQAKPKLTRTFRSDLRSHRFDTETNLSVHFATA